MNAAEATPAQVAIDQANVVDQASASSVSARAKPNGRRRSRIRRVGLAFGALAIAATAALGTATPTSAASSSFTGLGGEHDQVVVCDTVNHKITVTPLVVAMDAFKSGQKIATRVWIRDLTVNGAWQALPWQTLFVKSWHSVWSPEAMAWLLANTRAVLPKVEIGATGKHLYSVYVDYFYANASGVFTWEDMHPTSPYTTVWDNGFGTIKVTYPTVCQAGL